MGFIREDELISRKLKTCENCEWCIPIIEKNKKFEKISYYYSNYCGHHCGSCSNCAI